MNSGSGRSLIGVSLGSHWGLIVGLTGVSYIYTHYMVYIMSLATVGFTF